MTFEKFILNIGVPISVAILVLMVLYKLLRYWGPYPY
jgi:hypothetical protein